MEKEKSEKYSKYEFARILGARALQISMNAPVLINIKKEDLEDMNYDPLKIAELEFNEGILPISIKRPLPPKEEIEEEEEELEEEIERMVETKVEEKMEEVKEKVEEEKPEEKEEKEEKLEDEKDILEALEE